MRSILDDIAARLRAGDYKNEEHVRLAIVARLLDVLDWNIWNPTEVNTEFSPVRNEDASRVDIAVFMPPQYHRPAIFIEVKAVGKLTPYIDSAETQLRDYNRNNQAEISVLTDGRLWRFYLASAAGEFKQKCFEDLDLLSTELSIADIEKTFRLFLSKETLLNGNSVEQARIFLRRTDDQRTMFDVLPIAIRDAELDPTSSKVQCFVARCAEKGVICTQEDARQFILNNPTGPIPSNVIAREALTSHPTVTPTDRVASPPEATNQSHRLELKNASHTVRLSNNRGANATGRNLPNKKFLVFAQSIAAPTTPSFRADRSASFEKSQELIQQGILVPLPDGTFRLMRDIEFSSSSAAASVFMGTSASGPREWK
ncbi:MAG: DUF4357 domain-containing protein [Azonexus sp.]|nr:DUF4357 domain-containing protein [Azonexus sp.]MBP6202242.1 DUF4357 domain-containing protein [Azonexus sp.]